MSTVKSDNSDLTINADGSGRSVKFQANGVEKASIDSSGNFTSTSIDATKLSGALPAIDGSALTGVGKVLQVVNATYSTRVTSTTSTLADTGLTATITPSSTSSTILCLVTLNGTYAALNNTNITTTLLRGATTISKIDDLAGYTSTTTASSPGTIGINYVDSPASTAATTYKVQFASSANLGEVSINNYYSGAGNSVSTITLMEIGA